MFAGNDNKLEQVKGEKAFGGTKAPVSDQPHLRSLVEGP